MSLAPRCVSERGRLRRTLLITSLFTLVCGFWLAEMEWLLRHRGYLLRFGMDVSIASIGLATILARILHMDVRSERWLWAGAIALVAIGAQALLHNGRSAHFEAFVLLISVELIVQGALMLLSLGRISGSSHPAARGKSRSQWFLSCCSSCLSWSR